ncbi:DUF7373 family lipoprotein [Nocardia takedensis]|uniref:DUF7373 family lipoprotein n=1 Tax=Nocardia takedensis TaxID=259390 RepID=UPI00030CB8C3|nr:hypothetical protein [Nocardia takedensis]
MRFGYFTAVLTAVALVLSAGCSDPESSGPVTLDVSTLDSGNYPATPRSMDFQLDPKYGPLREAIRIGAVMPLILDTDGRFTVQRLTSPERRVIPKVPPALWGLDIDEFNEFTTGMIAGWTTSGERRRQFNMGRQITMHALRFTDAAAAATAADRLIERQALKAPGQAVTLPNQPAARAKFTPDKRYLDVWLPREDMLLYVHVDDPVSEPLLAEDLITLAHAALTDLIEGLRAYSPTPRDQIAALPVDVDGLLGRTLPAATAEGKADVRSMLLPAQAALHYDLFPATTKPALLDAGVDLVAVSDARVYRASDAAAADRLIAAFAAQLAEGVRAIDSPPGMPTVRCFETKDTKVSSGLYPPTCLVPYDRFVGRVTGQNVQELHQKAAAQYKLLAFR